MGKRCVVQAMMVAANLNTLTRNAIIHKVEDGGCQIVPPYLLSKLASVHQPGRSRYTLIILDEPHLGDYRVRKGCSTCLVTFASSCDYILYCDRTSARIVISRGVDKEEYFGFRVNKDGVC